MKRITAVMAAHVDAGKTTLSEALLFQAGEIRRQGRVDSGDCFLDNDVRERSRGITIFSKQAILRTENTEITLLDTPGHTDFSAETERAFTVADCAILVISGTDGVQPHTETLWELLARFSIPVFTFVNKTDISHKTKQELLNDLRCLSPNFADFSDNTSEISAEYDEDCMNSLLENGDVPDKLISNSIAKRNVFPVMFGSALKNTGIKEFLQLLERFSIPKQRYTEFAALVYKISTDANGARLTHMKITGGSLKNRSIIDNSDEKVTQIRLYSGSKFTTTDTAEAGQVVTVTGLTKTFAGQALGAQEDIFAISADAPLSYSLILPDSTDPITFYAQLKRLGEEEPRLKFSWLNGNIQAAVMGQIQLEVLQNVIAERFGVNIGFGEGTIAYRETIAETVEGIGHYEPLRHYAEVHLLLEPLPPGSGVVFALDCRDLDENWQRLIISNLRERVHIGVLTGSPITDIKITLVAGRAHQKHTEGGDFAQAAWRAVRQGLASAKSVLLEPFCRFKLIIPSECVGRSMTDLQRMGAEFSQPMADNEHSIIEGRCPISEMQGYSADVTGYTHGTGRLSTVLDGYYPCHNQDEIVEKIGYNFQNDVENSADSIFCSHGAGYLVKWNEVPNKMHIPSVLCSNRVTVTDSEISSYKKRIATDKELMEIFERTYGKINRSERTAMRRDKPLEQNYKSHEPSTATEYLLVDGYNIIFSWNELSEIARDNLDLARTRLINLMCNYQGFKRCNFILVFDAYKIKSDREIEHFGDVTVVYTKHAETADNYIERTAYKLAGNNRVRVATSDGTEQTIILGQGALRISAREFKLEVDEVMETIRKVLDENR